MQGTFLHTGHYKAIVGRKADARMGTRMGTRMGWGAHRVYHSSGNTAFDAYKADTLRRLEDEQEAFEAFLQRLRNSKDKSEFDTFMDERARANQAAAATPEKSSFNLASLLSR